MAKQISSSLDLSEDQVKLLVACFNDADRSHSFDQDKIAAATGTTKNNLDALPSVRMTRLRHRLAKVDLEGQTGESSAPGTPKTPKPSQAKAGDKRKTEAENGDGSPRKKATKAAGGVKQASEAIVKDEQVDDEAV